MGGVRHSVTLHGYTAEDATDTAMRRNFVLAGRKPLHTSKILELKIKFSSNLFMC
jgi:hypothetical protein